MRHHLNTILFAVFSIYFLSSLDAITARFALILEKASHCSPNSKIFLNYTFSSISKKGEGYCEFLESIEADSNMKISLIVHYTASTDNHKIINPTWNITKIDLCMFLNTDITYMPYVREFVYLEKFCPINKGIHVFHKSALISKHTSLYPMGCWKFEFKFIEKSGNMFACIRYTVQFLPTLNSNHYKCPV